MPSNKTIQKISKAKFRSLNLWNRNLAILHFVQAVAIVLLSNQVTFPVTSSYLTIDSLASKAGHPVLVAASRHSFDINLAYLVAAFFVISALAHLIIATVYRKQYEADLKRGVNKARWIEYALSASLMMVGIGLLAGVQDAASLAMIFALIAIMNLLGLVMEVHNQTTAGTNWLSYWLGCLAGIGPWLVIAGYLAATNIYGSGRIPTFVYWIFGSMFVLFCSFAVNMYLQYRAKGRWADYLYGERVYMILSLVAKSVLAWQVFFGSLRP